MVAPRLLRLQLCVWVSAAIVIPGISILGLSICALPSSLHPSPTPPRPPLSGGAGGGELGDGDWDEPDACSEVRLEVADAAA